MEWVLLRARAAGAARWVLLAIAWHADRLGGNAWPSVRRLVELTRYSERQVRACLGQLERSGELEVERGAGPRGVNRYLLPLVAQGGTQGGHRLQACATVEKGVENSGERGPPER
jgi:hypothetical protein